MVSWSDACLEMDISTVESLDHLPLTEAVETSKASFEWKFNRRNSIKRVCRYIYYRRDIHCGLTSCLNCGSIAKKPVKTLPNHRILIPNGEIFIHHFEPLVEWVSTNFGIIVLDSILKSIRKTNIRLYSSIRDLVENNNSFYLFSNTFLSHNGNPLEDKDNGLLVSDKLLNWYKNHGTNIEVLPLVTDINSNYSINKLALDCQKELNINVDPIWHQDKLDYLITDENLNYFQPHLSIDSIKKGLQEGSILKGTLRMLRGNYTIGHIQSTKGTYLIKGLKNLNRAINGDQVAFIQVKDPISIDQDEMEDDIVGLDAGGEDGEIMSYDSQNSQELNGRIIGIIQRNSREFTGSLQPQPSSNSNSRVFMPIDSRIPFINIKTRMSNQLEGKRITVKIIDWPIDSKRPNGHWVRILGNIGDLDVETQAILIENSINVDDFSDSAYKELPHSSWIAISEPGRIEWNDVTLSIDPPGCTDIDDAISFKKLDNTLRIGVHIADVSYFVKNGSSLDKEALKRCNTVYLVDRRHEMLPALLTSDICSLRSNVKRYAFSVIWQMDLDGNILDTQYTKSIICSRASLTYEQAQQIIQGQLASSDEIRSALSGLLELSTKLRQRRIDRGALELASAEVSFDLDESSQIRGLKPYKHYPTNKMVEEYMLLANTSVAKKLTNTFPYSLIRRHPLPQYEKLEELDKTLKLCGYEQLKYSNSKELNESFKTISQKYPHIENTLRILGTRCMSQAIYSNSKDVQRHEWQHYGLCVEVYTHFTSPIRRYADILVHRQLEAALGLSPLPEGWGKRLTESCEQMNEKHFAAKSSSRASIELFSYYLFKNSGGKITKGIITALSKSRITVMCPEFGIQVLVPIANKSGSYKLFDQINVKLESHDRFSRLSVAATITSID